MCFFNVHPYLGKISILANICQRGLFNHQLNKDVNHMAAMRVSHSPWASLELLEVNSIPKMSDFLGGNFSEEIPR